MSTVSLTSKGRITIPKSVRDRLHLRAGDKAELVPDNPGQAWGALRVYESGAADFSDYLIGIRKHDNGCEATYTFDKRVTGSDWHPALEESQ